MTDKLETAWELFFTGKSEEAAELVSDIFQLETCQDFSLLNLMTYLALEKEDFDTALKIMEKYLDLARQQLNVEQEHIGLHQLAMVYRQMNNFPKALELIELEEDIIFRHFDQDILKKAVNHYEQGYLRLKLDDLEGALSFMTLSKEEALQSDDLIAQACADRGLGEIYLTSQEIEQAKGSFESSISLFEQAEDRIGADQVKDILANIQM